MASLSRWGERHGRWWAFQWDLNRPFAVGLHLEHRSLPSGHPEHPVFGPHLDVHLPFVIVSVGRHPIYTLREDAERTYARGGIAV